MRGLEAAARQAFDHHLRRDSRRPLTVGLAVFGAPETGVDWSVITAATIMTMAPLLIAFLLFQRQFVQSFMRAGIR